MHLRLMPLLLLLAACSGPSDEGSPQAAAPSGPRPELPAVEQVSELTAQLSHRYERRPELVLSSSGSIRELMDVVLDPERSWESPVVWPVGPGRCSFVIRSSQRDRHVTVRDDMIMAPGGGGQLTTPIPLELAEQLCALATP